MALAAAMLAAGLLASAGPGSKWAAEELPPSYD